MDDMQFIRRAEGILHRMAIERTGWKSVFRRWKFSDEPLRNDAASLLRERGFRAIMENGTQYVGDDNDK